MINIAGVVCVAHSSRGHRRRRKLCHSHTSSFGVGSDGCFKSRFWSMSVWIRSHEISSQNYYPCMTLHGQLFLLINMVGRSEGYVNGRSHAIRPKPWHVLRCWIFSPTCLAHLRWSPYSRTAPLSWSWNFTCNPLKSLTFIRVFPKGCHACSFESRHAIGRSTLNFHHAYLDGGNHDMACGCFFTALMLGLLKLNKAYRSQKEQIYQ